MDRGESWSTANARLTNTDVSTLAIDPSTPTILYAGTTGGGVFKSTNGGGDWTTIASTTSVHTLAIDPASSSTLYAGTDGDGIFVIQQEE